MTTGHLENRAFKVFFLSTVMFLFLSDGSAYFDEEDMHYKIKRNKNLKYDLEEAAAILGALLPFKDKEEETHL